MIRALAICACAAFLASQASAAEVQPYSAAPNFLIIGTSLSGLSDGCGDSGLCEVPAGDGVALIELPRLTQKETAKLRAKSLKAEAKALKARKKAQKNTYHPETP